jgi:4-hydroxybenzoate polyprenyltransferase
VLLFVAGVGIAFLVNWQLALIGAGYGVLMIFYSTQLKHIVILDVFTVAAGFVIRIVAGAVAIQVPISPWLYICTSLGALFISVAKRRNEVAVMGENAEAVRPILQQYTLPFVDQMISILIAATVVAYGIYTFTAPGLPSNQAMMLTIPFVLYGVFRYLYLIYVRNEGGAPEDILINDRPILICVALWLATSGIVLVAFRGI